MVLHYQNLPETLDNIIHNKTEETLTNTGFYTDYETIRTLQSLSDTKNNPERVGFEPTNSFLLNDF